MTDSNFIDYIKIYACSGNGGKGSAHLRREKYIQKGGPDGGDGGKGGDVILRGNKQMWTLHHLRFSKHIRADHGEDGKKGRNTGSNGKNKYLNVPLGTIISNAETKEIIFEITQKNQEFILCKGGIGGLGNWHFKNATNQTPRYAQKGIKGVEGYFQMELKILADVGLVGFPNAGKSTLLSVMSAAKPKIGDYPFTTLKPSIGIVAYEKFQNFVMADIPGIIEGANEGKGLGHYFLRHIERNSVLLFVIPCDTKNIRSDYETLCNELKLYNPELLQKDKILAISKTDLLNEKSKEKLKKTLPKNVKIILISSITQSGIKNLKNKLWEMIKS